MSIAILLLIILVSLLMDTSDTNSQVTTVPVGLAWDYPTGTAVTGFNLYRKTGQTGVYTKVSTAIATVRNITDQAPIGQIICYSMTSLINTTESVKSTPDICTATVTAPVNLRIQ